MNGPEEIYRALVMGTGDYLRKSGFTKALIGLSGGVDSALTATVAVDALGKENVVGDHHALPLLVRGQHQRLQEAGR